MKKLVLLLAVVFGVSLVSCVSKAKTEAPAAAAETEVVAADTVAADTVACDSVACDSVAE